MRRNAGVSPPEARIDRWKASRVLSPLAPLPANRREAGHWPAPRSPRGTRVPPIECQQYSQPRRGAPERAARRGARADLVALGPEPSSERGRARLRVAEDGAKADLEADRHQLRDVDFLDAEARRATEVFGKKLL